MRTVGNILKSTFPEIQTELNFGNFEVIETAEDPPGHFQLKFPGDTIAKSNDFIRYRIFMNGSPKKGKDPIAFRLFAHFVACLHSKKDDELDNSCEVRVKDFMPDAGGKDYTRAREALIALGSMMVERYNEKEQTIDLIFERQLRYNRVKGTVRAKLNPDLKHFFLKLYEHYTTYGLLEFSGLRSFYSQRLFEIACSIHPKNQETFSLQELQHMLDITKGSALQYGYFKQKILAPSKKEINAKTNIKFDYEPIKEGRAVAYIKIKAKRMDRDTDILTD